jgi:hypothetical protein
MSDADSQGRSRSYHTLFCTSSTALRGALDGHLQFSWVGLILTSEARSQLGGTLSDPLDYIYIVLIDDLSCHAGLTPDGSNFADSFPNFDAHYQAPFTKFLSGIYRKPPLLVVAPNLFIRSSQRNPFANPMHFMA